MKKIRGSIFLTLLATLLLMGTQSSLSPTSAVHFACASNTGPAVADVVVEYQPIKKKRGLGSVFDWGLAKIENIYDGILVSDLITAFFEGVDHIFGLMIHSFREMKLSYDELHKKEVERLGQFDKEFRELKKLRNKIDRKCLYTGNVEDRSLCIDKGIEIHDKIQDLRSQRMKSEKSIERYKEMIGWCASYNNWFC